VRARLGARDQDRLLLYAGRLSREKRVHLLVDIVARLAGVAARRWLLVVAGDGPEGRALRADASSRVPGRVLFVGNLRDRAALADLHAGCDAFVHTNPAEPFGIAPLEAMASGLPLVAPRAGGVLSYACDATAWLTDGSARDFAKTLRMMVDIPGAVALRAVAGRARAPQWDSALMAQRLFETYDDWHRERQELQRQAPSALHAVADGPHGANGPTAGEVSP
jgi:alpha-1,6-mannosyltransferase